MIFFQNTKVSTNSSDRKSNLETHAHALIADINKLGEDWHRKIDKVIERHQSELSKLNANYLITINKHDEGVTQSIYEITDSIQDLKNMLVSNDSSLILGYSLRNNEFIKE